jgi:CRP-like cAMP-binding protein
MTRVSGGLRLKALAEGGWLSEESAAFRERMAAIGRWLSLPRGESVYEAGDEPMAVYGLGEGALDVLVPLGQDEEVLIHRAPPGFWIGDGTILTGTKRVLSVRTAVDARVFAIPGNALRHHLKEVPEDWAALQRLSARNAQLAVTVLAESLALSPRRRFACLLLRSASRDNVVHATQEDLGRLMGMSRMAFRRAFRDLLDQGVVRTDYGAVTIVDPARLAEIARRDDGS